MGDRYELTEVGETIFVQTSSDVAAQDLGDGMRTDISSRFASGFQHSTRRQHDT